MAGGEAAYLDYFGNHGLNLLKVPGIYCDRDCFAASLVDLTLDCVDSRLWRVRIRWKWMCFIGIRCGFCGDSDYEQSDDALSWSSRCIRFTMIAMSCEIYGDLSSDTSRRSHYKRYLARAFRHFQIPRRVIQTEVQIRVMVNQDCEEGDDQSYGINE